MAQAQDFAPQRGIVGALRGLAARAVRTNPGARVWALSVTLTIVAAIIYLLFLHGREPLPAPLQIPWWVIAALFCLADLKVIEVHFRRESHAFSLSELPAVLGLFFLGPGDYLLALLTGTGVALLLTSRQAPIKLAFNLANYMMLAVVTMAVFRAIHIPGGAPGFVDYMAAFAASLVATGVGAVSIASAITLSGGAPQFKKLPEMLQFGALVAVANTSIALLTVTILWTNPSAVWLLAVPAATLFLAYRAYVSEREKHERLEMVYQSSRILQHSPELDVALLALLDHARAMFRAELAEVVLQPSDAEHHALRTSSVQDGPSEVIVPIERMEVDPALRHLIAEHRAGFVRLPRTPGGREIPIRQAMVAPLVGESGMIGLLTIANRLTEGTAFGQDDLRLLETLANQAAVALENGQLEQSLAELSRLKEQLRYQAYHDPLTDLPNRSQFVEHATARLRASSADGRRPVVLLLDLDDFKIVNDTLGHAAGDDLLVMVTERIRGCVRDGDLAARLGGDEFAILVGDDPSLTDSLSVAQRLIDVLGITFPVHGEDVVVGVSIGIAMSTGPDQGADELLGNADVAMYTAKAAGKRRFAVFNPTMHAAIMERHEMSADLTRGIGRSELIIHHQPIVELRTGRIAGFEALVRWRHPTRGIVPPEAFISLAEESGSIVPLGQYVLAEAAREICALMKHDRGGRQPYLSVNVSAVQVQQADFLDVVEAALSDVGLSADQLVLEITETAMFRDTQATIHKLEALRQRGVRIAIDDFGTGYSSLTYLRRFPVDIIKIAQEFVGPSDVDTGEWAFTGAILDLGRRLGLQVIAEGIEEPGQLDRLSALGCEFGQGFLFARPAPLHELPAEFGPLADPPADRVLRAEAQPRLSPS